ncbi:MAG: hypothetical protein VB108_02900 [Anaerolineaceae bacterium]|nr:hypothetical protein [Anaerolineaceae bacterium]
MGTPAMIFLGMVFIVFAAIDIALIVSLIKPGDERKQMIVWKASTFTLLVTVLEMVINILAGIAGKGVPVNSHMQFPINTFIRLEMIALVYFLALLYFKKKYGE